jgi:hypothetical protein
LIASYRDKDTEKVASGIRVKKFEAIARTAQKKLRILRARFAVGTLGDTGGKPAGSAVRRPERKAQHPHQRSVQNLFHVERGLCV